MTEAQPQDKATIQEASRALHIDRKTIYRWISKGLISKHVEGNKTFVLMEEIKALCGKATPQDATSFVAESVASPNIVTVDRPHYEGLLIKLGQYEAERRYLLEYKTGLEAKELELSEIKVTLAANTEKLEKVKSSLNTNSAELEQAREIISKARSELQKMVELKQDSERKAEALLDQQAALEARERELRAEVERLRLPWWKRIFKK